MADMKPIPFPEHLKTHNLSEQELAGMDEKQKALAKDWNIIKRQNEWMMLRIIEIHNIMVDHDNALEQWKYWFKTITMLTGGGGGLLAVIYWVVKHGGGGP